MNLLRHWFMILLLGVPVVAHSAATASQSYGPTADGASANASADEGSQGSLTEIVVTAQRARQDIQTVPISMTALSQTSLDRLGIKTLSDLAAIAPGLVISTPGDAVQAYTDIAIRGIYSGDNSPTTAIYIDDTPVMTRQSFAAGYSGSPQPDIFDLDRVEVLRGPQGTLFGASAMGGAIRYITHSPNLQFANGYTKADVGVTDNGDPSYDLGVAFGAPIVPKHLGFRLSAWYQSAGGFVDMENPYSGDITKNANYAHTYVVQGSLGIAPVDGLTITPAVFIQNHHSNNSDQYWMDRTFLPNLDSGKYVVGANIPSPVDDRLDVYSLAIKYEFQGISFESNTSYLDRKYQDVDDWVSILPLFVGAPAGPYPGFGNVHPYDQNNAPTRQWQQEFRLGSQSPGSRVSWLIGAYFRRSSQQTGQRISSLDPFTKAVYGVSAEALFGIPEFVIDGQPFSSYTQFTAVDEEKALFGNIGVDITKRLNVSVGVRVERSSVIGQQDVYAGPISGTAYGVAYPNDQNGRPVTPRVAVTYQYSRDKMVYANAAKGFRQGGSNSPNVTQNSFCQTSAGDLGYTSVPSGYNSDSLWSYEIGTKDSLFQRHVIVDASAFYVNWKDIQTDVFLPDCGNTFTTNRGKVVSQGFDLQVATTPIKGLQLMGDVGYTNTYYPQAAYGAPSFGVVPVLNVAGQKLGGVMPWTGAVSVDYSWSIAPILPKATSYVRVDFRYLDSVPGSNGAVSGYNPVVGPDISDGYKLLNLRVGVTRGDFDVSLYADNVTRAHPRLELYDFGFLTATALRPLTVGITGEVHF